MNKSEYLLRAQLIDSCNSAYSITRSYDLPFIREKGLEHDDKLRRMSYFRAQQRKRMCIQPIQLDSSITPITTNLKVELHNTTYPGEIWCSEKNIVQNSIMDESNNIVILYSRYDSSFIRFLVNRKFDGVHVYYNIENKSWFIHHYYYAKGIYPVAKNRFGMDKKWHWLRFRNKFRYPIDFSR